MKKRPVDIVVISDVHLGTYGCHAKELIKYLKSINPKQVVLNGDIVDIWQFNKRYWPKSHMKVVKLLMEWIAKGVQVHYITGNHDEMMRKFSGFKLGSFSIVNKLVLTVHGKQAWIFHGDVFDVTMQHSKWLAKLGAIGYDTLILINSAVNFCYKKFGRGPVSMSKKIKNSVKSAVKFINNFEQTAADIAIENDFDYVVCGHIHQPEIKSIETENGSVTYLNSGDWIENLTALEYTKGKWELYRYEDDMYIQSYNSDHNDHVDMLEKKELFQSLMSEFNDMVASKVSK
ncbi:UDP-2,3-diacylglucosamine diphosphatase [Zobellia galactanivorans]|uniref:UDP-2,3-diacylglucosamine diphosphatase n=1 Tax=Zobellia galactanivorans (strain DSM 12802 / CCUG 47099 / CIP 106680 / NCIMB 13871 / Dsij) TaxID=63186 RepID=UPI001C079390|nr:UDP-2,3-diacylglucosamine diphosphatase [Zobellia galactanivorans]MBU3026837.1 UDP-2,3-diacylglucosamine diphosphatase [Zobellia galactanivorans]MDO6810899.1 UDP-2,3-diacylglucosamine diphosphatase [Zobellia galactanivorans]